MTIRVQDLGTLDMTDTAGEPLAPITPGEILRTEFLDPMGLSARRLAMDIGVPTNRITAILNGTRAITAPTALLLADRFGNSAEFWMNLQTAYDLEQARSAITSAA
jgi:addiction module HigA family antidote